MFEMILCSYNKYDQSQGGYEEAVMMGDPPAKEYNTYMMQEGQPQNGSGQYAQVIQIRKCEYLGRHQNNYPDIPHPSCPSYSPVISLNPPVPTQWLMGFSSPQRVAKMTKRLAKMIMDEAGITSIKP
jgi:hypothetical protein